MMRKQRFLLMRDGGKQLMSLFINELSSLMERSNNKIICTRFSSSTPVTDTNYYWMAPPAVSFLFFLPDSFCSRQTNKKSATLMIVPEMLWCRFGDMVLVVVVVIGMKIVIRVKVVVIRMKIVVRVDIIVGVNHHHSHCRHASSLLCCRPFCHASCQACYRACCRLLLESLPFLPPPLMTFPSLVVVASFLRP